MTAKASPIDRLRRLALRLGKPGDEDGEWFATALREFEAGARHGLTLGDAFGFRLTPGQTPFWESERIAKRDDLIRTIAAKHFSTLRGRPAAAALSRAIKRYEQGRWPAHKPFATPPPGLNGLRAALFRLLKLGDPPAEPTIRAIFSGSPNTRFREPDATAG